MISFQALTPRRIDKTEVCGKAGTSRSSRGFRGLWQRSKIWKDLEEAEEEEVPVKEAESGGAVVKMNRRETVSIRRDWTSSENIPRHGRGELRATLAEGCCICLSGKHSVRTRHNLGYLFLDVDSCAVLFCGSDDARRERL